MFRRVAFRIDIYTPKAIGSADTLDCCNVVGCCGGCYDEMGVRIAAILDNIGLRHVGEEHTSSLPDRSYIVSLLRLAIQISSNSLAG